MFKKLCLLCLMGLFALPTIAQSPKAVELYQKAVAFFDQDKPNEAFELLNKAIGDSPQYEQAIQMRARYFANNEQFDRALEDLSLLVRVAPQNILYLLERGAVFQNIDDYDKAETDYLAAYELDSTNVETLNALGSLYHVADLPEDAHKYVNKALAIDNKNHDAYYTRAWVYCEEKKYNEALADLKMCKSLQKDNYNAQRLEAICYLKQKKYDEVMKIFESFRERKVALMEEDFLYWGMAYFEKGDFKEASYYFNLPQKPVVEDLYHYAGKAYFKMNKIPESLQKLDSAIVLLRAKDGTGVETELSSPVYYDRAIVYHKAGKKRDAESDFLHACYLTPEIVAQKDYEGNPISLLDDAVKLLKISKKTIDSTRLKGYQDRAEALMLSGETNRTWAEIKKCEQVDSTHSRNSLLRAKVSAILGKFADGLTYLDKAEKQLNGKSDEEIAYYRAVIYHERGESLKAKEAIDKAIKLRPTEANYFSLLASIEFDTPNVKGALEAIQKALKMQPQNLDYILERAIYQYANDNFEETIKDCNRVIEQEPDNAEAFYQRGLAYRATKRYKEALLDFQKAEQYHNDEPELKELIKEMKGK